MRPTIYIMVGVPGSGKSTFIKNIFSRTYYSSSVICKDKIREMLHQGNYIYDDAKETAIRESVRTLFKELLKIPNNIIIDEQNLTIKGREWYITESQGNADIVAINFSPSEEYLKRRKLDSRGYPSYKWEEVHRESIARYEEPTYTEGFLDIYDVDINGEWTLRPKEG